MGDDDVVGTLLRRAQVGGFIEGEVSRHLSPVRSQGQVSPFAADGVLKADVVPTLRRSDRQVHEPHDGAGIGDVKDADVGLAEAGDNELVGAISLPLECEVIVLSHKGAPIAHLEPVEVDAIHRSPCVAHGFNGQGVRALDQKRLRCRHRVLILHLPVPQGVTDLDAVQGHPGVMIRVKSIVVRFPLQPNPQGGVFSLLGHDVTEIKGECDPCPRFQRPPPEPMILPRSIGDVLPIDVIFLRVQGRVERGWRGMNPGQTPVSLGHTQAIRPAGRQPVDVPNREGPGHGHAVKLNVVPDIKSPILLTVHGDGDLVASMGYFDRVGINPCQIQSRVPQLGIGKAIEAILFNADLQRAGLVTRLCVRGYTPQPGLNAAGPEQQGEQH